MIIESQQHCIALKIISVKQELQQQESLISKALDCINTSLFDRNLSVSERFNVPVGHNMSVQHVWILYATQSNACS